MARDRSRRTEGSLLLLFSIPITVCGLVLVFLARTTFTLPSDAINLNTADPDTLALQLEIDPTLAKILIRYRERHGPFLHTYAPVSLSIFPHPDERQRIRSLLRQKRLDVNALSVQELQRSLNLPRPLARRIVEYRRTLPEGRFRRPEALLDVPILDSRSIASLGERVIVRRPGEVLGRFIWMTGLVPILFFGVPILLRRSGVGGDPYLLPLLFILCGLGVMVQYSIKDPLRDTPVYLHHTLGIWLGLLAFCIGAKLPARSGEAGRLPARNSLRHYTYVWALAVILLLTALRLFGSGPGGVRITLGWIQPVEVIKLLLMLFAAGYLAERGDQIADALHRWRPPLPRSLAARFRGLAVPRQEDIGPILGVYAVALALFVVVRDLGPALVLFGAFLGTLYLATGRTGIVWLGLALVVAGGWLANAMHFGTLPVRMDMWRSPWENPHPNGMQLGQTLWAFSSGGVWGTGLGLGAPGAMPRSGSDLAFASLSEELGLIGGFLVLFIFVLLVWRGLKIALRAQSDFDRLLACSLTALMACQVFCVVGGVTGLIPLSGLSLPFVAYGNSSLVCDFFAMGLLRGISAPSGSVPIGAPNLLFIQNARRFATVYALMMLGVAGIGRLAVVQGLSADQIACRTIRTPDADGTVRAKVNPRLLALERAIPRGSIYDRRGRVLATSRLDEISRSFEDSPERARAFYRKGRYYPYGPALAHLIGYLDPALGGPIGLEREFHHVLRGFKDYRELIEDYRARNLPRWLTRRPPRQGSDLVLTIDAALQDRAVQVLQRAAGSRRDRRDRPRSERAAMVILDPTTGGVLVAASIPTFDPNELTASEWNALKEDRDRMHRLLDRTRYGLYPPGSTLKVATAAAALEAGVDYRYDCNHVAKNLRWRFRGKTYTIRQLRDDKDDPPHNVIKMARALRVSCNLYFAHLGLKLGPATLHRYFSERVQFQHIKPLADFAVDLPQNAFGQGTMLATPLEMALLVAAVANRGLMPQPLYWSKIQSRSGAAIATPSAAPAIRSRPLGEINAARLGEMMRSVVTEGTARGVFDEIPVQVSGKTGTAQTASRNGEPHSWFIGFAPYSRPQYAFACIIENGGYGRRGAAPAIREVLKAIYPP